MSDTVAIRASGIDHGASEGGSAPVLVKICGITDEAGLDAAVGAGADWVGFNFFARSPRFVTPSRAVALARRLPDGGPARVALFVEPTDADIESVLAVLTLNVLQVYAPADRLEVLRMRFGVPVWRPIGVTMRADLPDAGAGIDAFLIESKPPPEASRPGGNARSFDWSLTAGWRAPLPWLLAGGLTPDNVAAAIAASGARAVDVASGVERAKGVKDPSLIAAFVAAAKGAV